MAAELILSAALEYASYGWHVVPLHGVAGGACSCRKGADCPAAGKHPRLKEWDQAASDDATAVAAWWEKWPEANLGVLLGEKSGVIDIEGDGPGAETTIRKMFGDDPPVTPTFTSSRGKHRLFRFRGDLPGQGKNHFKIGDVEVRTGYGGMAAQSVFPPSRHASGVAYQWLVHPDDCQVATITDGVQAWMWNYFGETVETLNVNQRAKRDWSRVQVGVGAGQRNESLAAFAGLLIADMGDPFDQAACGRQLDLILAWNDRNRPPLGRDEVAATFNSILSRHRRQQSTAVANEHFAKDRPPDAPAEWRLEIIESVPRKYRLYSPLWASQTARGCIELEVESLMSPAGIRRAALAQADVWVDPQKFDRHWMGAKGIKSMGKQLVDTATLVAADPEDRRDVVVAEALLTCVDRARLAVDDSGPDPRGRPVRMGDGSVWLQVAAVLEDVGYTLAKIKHHELVECLKSIGAENKQHRACSGEVRRFKVLDKQSVRNLQNLANGNLGNLGDDEAAKTSKTV